MALFWKALLGESGSDGAPVGLTNYSDRAAPLVPIAGGAAAGQLDADDPLREQLQELALMLLHLSLEFQQISTQSLRLLIAPTLQACREQALTHQVTQLLPAIALEQASSFLRLPKFLELRFQRHLLASILRREMSGLYLSHLTVMAQRHLQH